MDNSINDIVKLHRIFGRAYQFYTVHNYTKKSLQSDINKEISIYKRISVSDIRFNLNYQLK